MQNYYFTFGHSHRNLKGEPMHNYWVKVSAPDYGTAREVFCAEFATPVMGSPTKWAFQYEEKDFDAEWYPGGEYACLTALLRSTPLNSI